LDRVSGGVSSVCLENTHSRWIRDFDLGSGLKIGSNEMTLKIIDITGEFALSSNCGQQLYDLIFPLLKSSKAVELDFSGVAVVASAFFNVAIGQLLQDFDADDLNRRLKIVHIAPNAASLLRHVLANAKRYYGDPRYQIAVDSTMEEYAASL
jgi:hypothetical protein